jgi:hypothetical protein
MYTTTNFKTKKELQEAVAAGKKIGVYQPNDMFNRPNPTEGAYSVEGPHYPKPHRWAARVILKDGAIIKVS